MSADFPNDGMCHETSGFLFNHKCDRFSIGKCFVCQKPLCDDHSHLPPGETQTICTSCLKKKRRQATSTTPTDDRSTTHTYYEHYNRDPYFYGSTYYPGYGRVHTYHTTQSTSPTPSPVPTPTADQFDSGDFSSEHDPNDFTEGDAESSRLEDDADFESDMGAS